MLAILFCVSIFTAVYVILHRFGSEIFPSVIERVLLTVPLGIAVSSLLVSAGLVFLPLRSAIIVTQVFSIAVIVLLTLFKQKTVIEKKSFVHSRSETIAAIVVTSLMAGFLIFISIQTLLPASGQSISIPKQASVDVVYHLSQVTTIGLQTHWHFTEPNFSGEYIRYPYLVNMFSAIGFSVGSPLAVAFHLPTVLLFPPLIYGLWALSRQFKFGIAASFSILIITLLGGGLTYLLGSNYGTSVVGVAYPQQYVDFAGLLAGFLLVQRAFILGLPLLLFAVLAFIRGIALYDEGREIESVGAFKWAGVLLGVLPLAHSHSFIVGALIFGLTLCYFIVRRNPIAYAIVRGTVFYSVLVGILPLFFIVLSPQYNFGGTPTMRLGWMSDPFQVGGLNLPTPDAARLLPWFRFMVTNFGTLLLLPGLVLCLYLITKLRILRSDISLLPSGFSVVMSAGLALWVFPNVIQMQTWDYDTNKFFVYAILFSALSLLLYIRSFSFGTRVLVTILFLISLIASLPIPLLKLTHVVARENQDRVIEFKPDEQDAAVWIRKYTPEDSVVLSVAANASRESLLNGTVIASGRTATVGYITWLYTHGIDYEERLQKVQKFFLSGQLSDLEGVPADYLVVDPLLREQYPHLEDSLGVQRAERVYKNSSIAIYKLK